MADVLCSIHSPEVIRGASRTFSGLFIIACLALISANTGAAGSETPVHDATIAERAAPEKLMAAETAAELHRYLLGREANIDLFRTRGPFRAAIQEDRELRLTTSERIPGAVGQDSSNALRRLQKPVMVLGADDDEDFPRNRDYFYEFIRSAVAEVSIRDAVHEDAQWPSQFALQNGGVDPNTTEALQVTFVSALAAAAISLSATGTFEYAWASFRHALQNGRFFNAKQK